MDNIIRDDINSDANNPDNMITYFQKKWVKFSDKLDKNFEITERNTSVQSEIICGFVQFFSCLYVLPVVPEQMNLAGYNKNSTIVATSSACAIGSILASYLTNLPFIIAPPTGVSIYLSNALRMRGIYDHSEGDSAVMLSGMALLLIGVCKPLNKFIKILIPDCIQASTAVGIGLITALAGAIEIKLVVRGSLTILSIGDISWEIVIATVSLIVASVALYYHIKGSFVIGLIFGTITWWLHENNWPSQFIGFPEFDYKPTYKNTLNLEICSLFLSLVFLYILTLSGLTRLLSDQSNLTLPNGAVPRGHWFFIVCGFTTIISGYLSGPPILISPESASGIKSGAKTGLSTLICGLLFGISTFFSPLFASIPPSGTSPLLILVGMLLFQNVSKIDWKEVDTSVSSFLVLSFIPFTYSIPCGIGFGYVLYITINLMTGNLSNQFKEHWNKFRNNTLTTSGIINGQNENDYQSFEKTDCDKNIDTEDEIEILETTSSISNEERNYNNHNKISGSRRKSESTASNDNSFNEIIRTRRRSESVIDTLFPMNLHHSDQVKSNFYNYNFH